jgi:hypothetical protein
VGVYKQMVNLFVFRLHFCILCARSDSPFKFNPAALRSRSFVLSPVINQPIEI